MRDLTFSRYGDLLCALRTAGFRVNGIADWLQGEPASQGVILRHDVDRRVSKAVAMAHLEAEMGIRSTYYFRCGERGFPSGAIREVDGLGHEVGYHYETLSQCDGESRRALERFSTNLQRFRSIAPCKTICAHGSPLSRHDNRELFRDIALGDYGLIGDALSSFTAAPVQYLTDTGGRFSAATGPGNLRDGFPGRMHPNPRVARSVSELIEFATSRRGVFYLNIHPERWALSRRDLWYCVISDWLAAIAKALVSRLRMILAQRAEYPPRSLP